MRQGLYYATYGETLANENVGYAVVRDGRIYCINGYQAFSGSYVESDGQIAGTIRLAKQIRSAPRRDTIIVNFDGLVVGDEITLNASAKDAQAVPFRAVMTWIAA